MPTVISLGSWYIYAVLIAVAFFVLWFVFGGRRNMEARMLQPPRSPEGDPDRNVPIFEDYPVSVSPRYVDPAQFLPQRLQRDPEAPVEEAPAVQHRINMPPFRGKRFRSIGEELTCTALEDLLGRKVEYNIHPEHLRNPRTGRKMEYDCFDPVSKIAVEYNGRMHDEYIPRFHRSIEDFKDQQYRDAEKARLSAQAGIPLIIVSHTVDTYDDRGRYNSRISREERYAKIHAYLAAQLQRLAE